MNDKKYYFIAGITGAVCLIFAVAYFLIKREMSPYVLINLAVGIGLTAYFLYYNIKDVEKLFINPLKTERHTVVYETALVIAVVIVVNLLSSLFYFGKDLTRDRASSISDESQKVIQWIKEPLVIQVFSTKGSNDFEKFLLDSYNFYNKRITYKFVDPEKNPQLAQDFGITKNGEAAITYKDGHFVIPSVTEQDITNGIIRMTQPVKNKVYFMTGHGEHALDDGKSKEGYALLAREMIMENYVISMLKLEPPNYYIPGNCTILVVGGPRKMYTEMEVHAIKEYLEASGRAIFMLDPNVTSGLEGMLLERNVKLENDCMIDVAFPSLVERMLAKMSGRRAAPKLLLQTMVNDFPDNEITQSLKNKSLIFPVTQSLTVADEKKFVFDMKVEPLAKTTNKGWGETNLDAVFGHGTIRGMIKERRGPRIVAMLSIKGLADSNNKVVVVGDSEFVNNEFVHQLYNRDFFMNCLAYLSNQANMISVRPRHMFASRLDYDPSSMSRIFTFSVLVFPQLLLMAGLSIWWLRKQ